MGSVVYSVIMPAYCEGHHIYSNVQETAKAFDTIGSKCEIIVVDDGSCDNTFEEAQRASRQFQSLCGVSAVQTGQNKGKGAALKVGFNRAQGERIVFLDSDLDIHPRQLRLFMNIMDSTSADVVIGCKRHPESQLKYPLARRVMSSGYFFLVRILFGLPLRDTQTGLKLFKRDPLKLVMPHVRVERFAFDLELLVRLHQLGCKIVEAPVVVDFKGRFGRIRLKDILVMFYHTVETFFRLRLRRGDSH